MTMYESDEMQLGKVGPDVEIGDGHLKYADIKPSEILVQILKRPSDPITQQLDRSIKLWLAEGMAVQTLHDPFAGWIDVARNWQSQLFVRNPQFKFALMVDSDVGATPEAPFLLARHNLPVVSACVPSFTKEKGLFLCIAMKGPDGKARFPQLNNVKQIPASGVMEIHNAGTGCLMVRRDVMDKLWHNFHEAKAATVRQRLALTKVVAGEDIAPVDKKELIELLKTLNYEDDLTGAPFSIPQSVRESGADKGVMAKGEDICFTDRVRDAGFKLYVDFEVHCYHEKMMALHWPKEAMNPDLSIDDWQVTAFDAPVVQV